MKAPNIKYLKFAYAYVEQGDATAAYVSVYGITKGAAAKAKVLLGRPEVIHKIMELKAKIHERHEITVDTLTEMLLEDRKDARAAGQFSASIAAIRELGKLHGLIIDRKEITVHGAISAMNDKELSEFIGEVSVDYVDTD
jgi:phage terminase small subunit